MDPSDLAILQRSFGSSVSRYLSSCNVDLRRTKSGAYLISSRGCFDACRDLIANKDKLEDIRNAKVPRKVSPRELVQAQRNESTKSLVPAEPGNATNHSGESSGQQSKNVAAPGIKKKFGGRYADRNLTIFSTSEYEKNGPETPQSPLNFSPLTKRRSVPLFNEEELYRMIMETNIGLQYMNGHDACRKDLCQILAEFQRRHGKFQYWTNLRKILDTKGNKMLKEVPGITLMQFQQFMYSVFAFVIPKALFGSWKNVKTVRKSLKAYYLSPYNAPFCLKPCIDSLKISSIPWLKAIKDPDTRLSVVAKVTKWFYESFFIPLLNVMFHERKSLYNQKRIMVSSEHWRRFKSNYIERQVNRGHMTRFFRDDEFTIVGIPSATVSLYPKSNGLRPIYRIRRTDSQQQEIDILRTFLQQQYLQRYDFMKIDHLHPIWLKYATPKEGDAGGRVNLVTCDVTDAFGSIIRKKLFDIVNAMIDEIRDVVLTLQWYELILPSKKGQKLRTEFKRWFSCCPSAPFVRNRSLIAASANPQHETVHVRREYIRDKLAAHIFEQTVFGKITFKGQQYMLTNGIMQGSELSPILSEIYYQHMMVEEFGIFMQSGTLLRYVDDFVYITKSEDSAKRFLKAIKKGVPAYNCRFQRNKIKTNVPSQMCEESAWVSFLGFELNGNTMQVRPNYDNREFQYLPWLEAVARTNSLKIFAQRSMYFKCLKLNRIVLDPKINGLNGLYATAGRAADLIAERCAVLLSTIFVNMTPHKGGLMKQFRVIVRHLEKHFCCYLRTNDRKMRSLPRRYLLIAIWRSFSRIFAKNVKLRDLFYGDLRRIVRSLTAI